MINKLNKIINQVTNIKHQINRKNNAVKITILNSPILIKSYRTNTINSDYFKSNETANRIFK